MQREPRSKMDGAHFDDAQSAAALHEMWADIQSEEGLISMQKMQILAVLGLLSPTDVRAECGSEIQTSSLVDSERTATAEFVV